MIPAQCIQHCERPGWRRRELHRCGLQCHGQRDQRPGNVDDQYRWRRWRLKFVRRWIARWPQRWWRPQLRRIMQLNVGSPLAGGPFSNGRSARRQAPRHARGLEPACGVADPEPVEWELVEPVETAPALHTIWWFSTSWVRCAPTAWVRLRRFVNCGLPHAAAP
jgi:hypothetical protein